MLRRKLLPTFNAIPGTSTAGTSMVDLPLGLRYHSIYLDIGDTGGDAYTALIDDIRIKINGNPQRTHSASELNYLNAVNGSAFAIKDGGTASQVYRRQLLPIYFAEPWRKDIAQAQLPAWNVAGANVGSFQIEVDWKGSAALAGKRISGFYEAEPATGSLGVITKVSRQGLAAAGLQQDFNLLPLLPRNDFLQSIQLHPTATPVAVWKAKLTANGVEVQDLIDYIQNRASLLGREMNPSAVATSSVFDLVLDFDDPLNGALKLSGLNELSLHVEYGTLNATTYEPTLTTSATSTLTALFTHVGAPN